MGELPPPPARVGSARIAAHLDDKLQVDLDDEGLERRAKAMKSLSTAELEETGGSSLYIALGFLEWFESRESSVSLKAPLVLIPCEIEKTFDARRGRYTYSIRHTGEEVQYNVSLAMKLRQDFNLELPEFEPESTPEQYFNEVRKAVRSETRWSVRREGVIGFFAFAKLLMYRDLDPDNWKSIENKPLVRALFEGSESEGGTTTYAPDYQIDANTSHRDLLLAVDADSSQHSAIIDVLDGKSLVIEGPPGTGKSQTITNIIAATMAAGKTVLFVAEKMAALEVVQRNLQRVGLGAFCLEMHSHKSRPAQVYASLLERMNTRFTQAHALPGQMAQVHADREAIAGYLEATKVVTGPHSEPLFNLFWRIAALRAAGAEQVRATVSTQWNARQLQERLSFFDEIHAHVVEVNEGGGRVWDGFQPTRYFASDSGRVAQALATLRQAADSFLDAGSLVSNVAPGWPTLRDAHSLAEADGALIPPECLTQSVCTALAGGTTAKDIAALCSDIATAAAAKSLQPELWALAVQPEFTDAAGAFLALHSRGEAIPHYRAAALDDVRQAIAELDGLLAAIAKLQEPLSVLRLLGFPLARNVHELQRVSTAFRCLADPVIRDRSVVREEVFFPGAAQVLKDALARHEVLESQASELSKHFVLRDVPSAEEIAAIRRDLRAGGTGMTRWFRSSYRAAHARCRVFRRPKAPLEPAALMQALEVLEDLLLNRSRFASDDMLKRALGPGFTGVTTEWDRVRRELAWGQTAVRCGLSHQGAVQLLTNIDNAESAPTADELEYMLGLMRRSIETSLVRQFKGNDTRFLAVSFSDLAAVATKYKAELSELVRLAEIEPSVHFRTVAEAKEGFERVLDLRRFRQNLAESRLGPELFGDRYQSEATDTAPARATLDWCAQLRKLPLPEAITRWLLALDTRSRCAQAKRSVALARAAAAQWKQGIDELSAFGPVAGRLLPGSDWQGTVVKLGTLSQAVPQLLSWANLCRALAEAAELGLESFVRGITQGAQQPSNARQCFELTFYEAIARESLEGHPALRKFTRQRIEQVRNRFQTGDKSVLELARKQMALKAADRLPPAGNSKGRVKDLTEASLIRNEVQKSRAHCKLRQLMLRAGRAVQALKPCFMMSPLTVAQQLPPGEIEFDLVIMDEASQIKPADALGAIARGRQVVVVGDPKQLPPTSFFDRATAGLDDADDALIADDAESVLEVALKAYPLARRLRWHYRSQHEALISFSNEKFYDRDLVVFPSPTVDAGRLGVRHHFVSGATCAGGKNPFEADAVARAIIAHAQANPNESLGVGAFNAAQRDLIEECLEQQCIADPTIRVAVERLQSQDEGLFIKNLENLQGDERDVIFISYTYGPDPATGVVRNFFGPINGEQGWRRLNVLITRARRRLEVFASMHPEDIKAEPGKSRGVHAMRDFLEYAMSGKLVDRGARTHRLPDSPFEEAVGKVLSDLGVGFVPQVGVAGYYVDIGVLAPGSQHDFVLGIECDGATYHSARSARDRDRLREEVITRRGWKLHRIWSTDWFLNQPAEELRLREAVTKSIRGWGTIAS
jgi:very-short-patch-repair endonuclease